MCSENKGADQLLGYHTADLHLCFVHMQKAEFLMAPLIIQNEGSFFSEWSLMSLLHFEEIQEGN